MSLSRRRFAIALASLPIWLGWLGWLANTAHAQTNHSLATSEFRIAFGSCLNQDGPQHFWPVLQAARPDALVLMGDNIYAMSGEMSEVKSAYDKLRAEPHYTALRRFTPVFAVWDDNDYGKKDAGKEFAKKEESKALFLDAFDVPASDPRRGRPGIYTSELIGPPEQRIQLVLLDTRTFRDPLLPNPNATELTPYLPHPSPGPQILGDEQWKWLEEQLRAPAKLRLIVSSIQVFPDGHHFEKWGNFPAERERLVALIKRTKASGVMFLSGDRHHSEMTKVGGVLDYPLIEVTASSFNRAREHVFEPNAERIGEQYYEANFGVLTVDWKEADPKIVIEIRAATGATPLTLELRLSDITLTAPKS